MEAQEIKQKKKPKPVRIRGANHDPVRIRFRYPREFDLDAYRKHGRMYDGRFSQFVKRAVLQTIETDNSNFFLKDADKQPPEPKHCQFTIGIGKAVHERLREYCQQHGEYMYSFVLRSMENAIDHDLYQQTPSKAPERKNSPAITNRVSIPYSQDLDLIRYQNHAQNQGETLSQFAGRAILQAIETETDTFLTEPISEPPLRSEIYMKRAVFVKVKAHCEQNKESVSHFLLRSIENTAMNDCRCGKEV